MTNCTFDAIIRTQWTLEEIERLQLQSFFLLRDTGLALKRHICFAQTHAVVMHRSLPWEITQHPGALLQDNKMYLLSMRNTVETGQYSAKRYCLIREQTAAVTLLRDFGGLV